MARTALFCAVLALALAAALAAAAYRKRETIRACTDEAVCGWAVYKKTVSTLPIDYYVRNQCVCPEGKKCLYDSNDVSINSYIYRCKVETGGGSSTFPENA